MLAPFYDFSPAQETLQRSRRAALAKKITEADRDGFTLWLFCPWCGHALLQEARWVVAQVKDPPNMIEELEKRVICSRCRRHGVHIIPTDRTMVSFDRMGASKRT